MHPKIIQYTAIVLLACATIPASAEKKHFIDVWAGGGYDALMHGIEHTKVPGGGGFNLGAGYELNVNNFVLQTGADFQYFSSKTRLLEHAEDYSLYYDDGFAQSNMTYHYNFLDYFEKHKAGYINVPILLGFKFDRYYALVGTKVGLNLIGNYASDGQLHPTVTEPMAIEDFTTKYDPFSIGSEGSLDLGMNVTASAEFGVTLDEWLPRNMTRLNNQSRTPVSYRAALFVDYGLMNLNKSSTTARMAEPHYDAQGYVTDPTSVDYSYLPASTLAEGKRFANLYTGVKLTVQFDMTKPKKAKPERVVPEPLIFYAHVFDAETEADMSGVEVTVRAGSQVAFKGTTDADGMVNKELRRGRYTVSVQEKGYQAFRQTVPHYSTDTTEIALQRIPDLVIRVYDAETYAGVKANVELRRASDNNTVFQGMSDETGYLVCDVRSGRYQAYAEAEGYVYGQELVDFSQSDTVAMALQPIKKDVAVVLHNLFFALNSAELLPESEPSINDLYQFLVQNPDVQIHIVGHTDSTGSLEYNMRLSNNRAKSVFDELVGRGIEADRLTYEGRGPNEPVADNDTEEGRAANRRVEFVIK